MKRCARCTSTKDETAFAKCSANKDGLQGWCLDCARDYMRGRKGDATKRRAAAKSSAARHPERRQAREKVKDMVRSGALPVVRTCACVDCGQPAVAYDHHLGYAHPRDVQPVCSICHGKRSRSRGEHKRQPEPGLTPAARAGLEAELAKVQEKINAAYWAFTRQARAKPPSLVVPEAYRRRREIEEMLRGGSR